MECAVLSAAAVRTIYWGILPHQKPIRASSAINLKPPFPTRICHESLYGKISLGADNLNGTHPTQVILDGNFIHGCISMNVDIEKRLASVLQVSGEVWEVSGWYIFTVNMSAFDALLA